MSQRYLMFDQEILVVNARFGDFTIWQHYTNKLAACCEAFIELEHNNLP